MTPTTAAANSARARPGRLPARVAFYLQASIVVAFLAGSSAPTPLYSVYQAEWGFSPISVTVIFGVYAVALLAALLTVGSLSDYVGRRPVLLVSIVLQASAMLVFATASGVPSLLAARIVQGLSVGAAAGALGAGLLDLDKLKGTIANAVSPPAGTATGALGAGLLVAYAPERTHLVYLVLFVIFGLQAIGVLLMAESAQPRRGALASIRPRFALPQPTRRPMLVAAPALVAGWALAGFYGSLGPALIRQLAGSDSLLLGGLALFTLAGSAALSVPLLRTTAPRTVMLVGPIALLIGVGIVLLSTTVSGVALFFVGTALAGVGFGAGFQGAVRTVAPLAAVHDRAAVLSVIYLVSYLAMGLPAILAGVLVVHGGGVMSTAREYGAALMLLAALAALGLVWRRVENTPAPDGPTPLAGRPHLQEEVRCPAC